ncbi:MAG: hypothetical protein JO257_34665 [Deltaproteobacteria bacterium]|nr:hypothetical protein [Deltaproteobacteria bacterium]
MTPRAFVVIALLAGCASHGPGAAPVDSSTDASADAAPGADAATDAAIDGPVGSASGFPAMLAVGASNGNVTVPFGLAAHGMAGTPYGAVAFSGDVGTIDLGGGAAGAFVYATVPEAGYTLYDGFAVSATSWDAFYLYCHGSALADVYDERVSGHAMVYAPVSGGACSDTGAQTVAHVALPAFSIPRPAPVGGYAVSGSAIHVAQDGTGTLDIAGTTMPLIVFDDVDCRACGGAGWYELHTVVWDATHERTVFVIVYLINGSASSVELAYARSLPDLGDPIGTRTLAATWMTPAARHKPAAAHGMTPPSLRR